ncbi:MAG: DUF4149 domain-containing protein [Paracoccaceae bacterium]|nr:DUF4149 domain-containing protein [Paracoccaceae bacterium]
MEIAALLLTATLFGGMALYSFGFAPFLFRELSPAQAGPLIRAAFPHYYLFVIVGALATGLVLMAVDTRAVALMGWVAALGVLSRQVLMPQINAARDAELAGETVARSRFAALHGVSVAINFVQLGLIGWVLVRFL